jgi:hypothetical protein
MYGLIISWAKISIQESEETAKISTCLRTPRLIEILLKTWERFAPVAL